MASVNRFFGLGNITRDPEARENGPVKFAIAMNRRFKTRDGESKEETCFLDAICWGNRGQALANHFAKGDPIFVEGHLQNESWEDKKTGEKRSKLSLVVDDWQFVGGKGKGGNGGVNAQGNAQAADDDDIPY